VCHARTENHVVMYQVECVHADGTVYFIPMCGNFEIGGHITAACQAEGHSAPREHLSTSTFSRESLAPVRGKSMRRAPGAGGDVGGSSGAAGGTSFGPATVDPHDTARVQAAQAFVREHTATSVFPLGDTTESIEKILVRMHGSRGIPIHTRRHPVEPRDVPNCTSGADVLDWVSTTFHLYDASMSPRAAQMLLDRGLIVCVAVMTGRPADRFSDNHLYVLKPREEPDALPTVVPAAKSRVYDLAMSCRASLEEASAKPSGQFCCKGKVCFVPRQHDSHYVGLTFESMALCPVREFVTLKVKSMGSAGDHGCPPNPTGCTLQLSVCDVERKRGAATAAAQVNAGGAANVDLGDHYNLIFGADGKIDPQCCLHVDLGGGTDATTGPVLCAIDGDVFGPFVAYRIKPVLAPENAPATIPFMSYLPCSA